MTTNDITISLKKTFIELRNVEDELNRPLEDVVTLSACYNVRQSMMDMMHLYLQSHSIKNHEGSSLEDLLTRCIKVNKQFSAVDLSKILCKEHDHAACTSQYCLTTEKVTDCLLVANQIKGLLVEKMTISEND